MSETLPEVPYETKRKSVKAPTKASWSEQLAYFRAHAHEVWTDDRLDWTWYVLKSYQKDDGKPYARWFCLVDGFESELGDVYVAEVKRAARRVR